MGEKPNFQPRAFYYEWHGQAKLLRKELILTYQDLPEVREGELSLVDRWKEIDLLGRSWKEREDGPTYVFYDGPPTANGRPGVHHVISRTLKDMTCRFKTMQGYKVRRKAGWDTHGLPVEIQVEKELGFHNKQQIEDYGIEKFNEKCRESVFMYSDLWKEMSEQMAYLCDMENPYITLSNDYIETVWHLIDHFFKEGLVYKGAKILPYCPRCGTGLASHEVAQGYQEDKVTTVYAKFPVKGRDHLYFLAWTTTPWTLLSNVSLTVHPDVDYVLVQQGEDQLILAKDLMKTALRKEYGEVKILKEMKGKDLEYTEYDQLLPFIKVPGKAFFVTCADYVTTTDGTGVVHTAPAFGEDDYQTGLRYKLPFVQPVGSDGAFNDGPYKGTFVMDTDPDVIQYLAEHGYLYAKQKIVHNYPHCWRCHTPLIYYAKPSWYIKMSEYREALVRENNKVNWVPDYIGQGRFGNWLENLKDWAISRSRYWGTPLNIWVCPDCGHAESIESRKELRERAQEEVGPDIDLHRPYVDRIHLTCPKCGGTMNREADVLDVWFDSGAMPFAQLHYPFEHQGELDQYFPADFICEGIDQTRGWFYTLMAISVLYTGKAPYKNVLVNDLVLDKDGQKMSKSKGNTIDPFVLFEKYGADVVRFYTLYVSPTWLPTKFDEDGLKEVNAKFFRSLKNIYAMFSLYANTNGLDASALEINPGSRPEIDRWLISRFQSLYAFYLESMEHYQYNKVVHAISDFVVEDMSNWYIRRSRDRFWSSEESLEVQSVFQTTYEVLLGLSKMLAPITPFLAEELYQALTQGKAMDTVHLENLDRADTSMVDRKLERKMDLVRKIVNLGRASREDAGIKVRQPLLEIQVDQEFKPIIDDLTGLIKEELNVKNIVFSDHLDQLMNIQLKPNYKVAGKILGSKIKEFARYLSEAQPHELLKSLEKGPLTLTLGGEETEIPQEDIQVTYEAKEGYDVMMEGEVSVVLDTALTDELIQEGYAREFISRVQKQRKENGYQVTDRIRIAYSADEEIVRAFQNYASMIQDNTLAIKMERKDEINQEPVDINGHPVAFCLKVEK